MLAQIFRATPILIFPAIIYAALALSMGEEGMAATMASAAFTFGLPSGATWTVTNGHALTLFAATALFLEVVKSAQPTNMAMLENGISFMLFTACLMLFLLVRPFGTMEFFLIMVMMMIDFLAGAAVMIMSARRDVGYIAT